MNHSFSTQQLSVQRGDHRLLKNVDLTVSSGEMLRIVGANGSGKTSLIRILAGLSQPDSGDILWDKKAISSEELLPNISYLGHRDGNKLNLTVIENLRFQQHLLGVRDEQQLLEILNKLSLLERADVLSSQLSFGQKRRLAFARLLIVRRPLWLLDEPFTGVDVNGKALLEDLCQEHLSNQGMMVLTHHGDLDSESLKRFEHELDLAQFAADDGGRS